MKKVLVCLFILLLCVPVKIGAATYTSGNTTITTSGTTITVSPKPDTNGAMADYTYSDVISWVTSSMTRITIEEGVTHIGAYAFMKTSNNLTRVDIPTSVTSIGGSAFAICYKIEDIYYAGSPNEWASITFTNNASNPFGDSNASNRKFHLYGCDFTTKTLTLEPGITTVNAYAFYNASLDNLNIPGTVSNIGAYAFACAVKTSVCVNRTTPPTAGTRAITYGSTTKLYVPSGATTAYNNAGEPWKGSSNTYGPGATAQAVSGTLNATYGSGVKWSLDQNGILTFDASAAGASKTITLQGGTDYPWGNFRRLVHKIKLKGEITALGNALAYHWFLRGIILDQTAVPTCSNNIGSSSITATGTTAYNSIINPCHPLVMEVPLSTILDDTESAKLETAPWNDGHWQVTVTDEVLIDEDYDNISLLNTLHDKLSAPFNMRLKRSVSNAYYNTFCSPIDMDAALVTSTFGAGTRIHALTGTSYDEEANELTLIFADSQDYIDGGVPYIIWPANNVTNPTFVVDPEDVATAEGIVNVPNVAFRGTLAPRPVADSEISAKSFIFLQANNLLNWANTGTLKGMRAYWLLTGDVPAPAFANRPKMSFGNPAPQGMEDIQSDKAQCAKVLRNGQLYIMHNGQMYDIQGRRLQ